MTSTTPSRRELAAGDVCWVDFDPARGTEQRGARPALVISSAEFNRRSRRAIVCPVTRNRNTWPTKVILPVGLVIEGAVLVDQIRSMDRAARGFRFIGTLPDIVLDEVREVLAALVGFDLVTGKSIHGGS